MKRFTSVLIFFTCLATACTTFAQSVYLKDKIKEQRKLNHVIGKVVTSPLKSTDSTVVHLADYEGKYLVVDFWYTKCGPCFREFPYLDKIKDLFKENEQLAFINICSISGFDEWKEVIKQRNISGINLFDDNALVSKRRLMGPPKSTGQGIIHDQLYLLGYPSYAFINSRGQVLGATSVPPSDQLLFSYYIDGLLKNRNIDESLKSFTAEVKSDKLSDAFLLFMKERFNLGEADAYKIVLPYKKYF